MFDLVEETASRFAAPLAHVRICDGCGREFSPDTYGIICGFDGMHLCPDCESTKSEQFLHFDSNLSQSEYQRQRKNTSERYAEKYREYYAKWNRSEAGLNAKNKWVKNMTPEQKEAKSAYSLRLYRARRAAFLAANPGYVQSYGFNPEKPGMVYIMLIESMQYGTMVGYGISNVVDRRLKTHHKNLADAGATVIDYYVVKFSNGADAAALESIFDEMPRIRTMRDVEGFKTESMEGDSARYRELCKHAEDLADFVGAY